MKLNRNTFFDALGNQGDTLEKIYAYLESTISPHLNNAINDTTGKMAVETLRNLIFLAYLTKWRNPLYDESFENLKETFTVDDLGLGLRADGERLDIELEKFSSLIFRKRVKGFFCRFNHLGLKMITK